MTTVPVRTGACLPLNEAGGLDLFDARLDLLQLFHPLVLSTFAQLLLFLRTGHALTTAVSTHRQGLPS